MITRQDLEEAIAECKGERNPNAQTCIKLAAYYTIMEHMEAPTYSFSAAPSTPPQDGESAITYEGESDFARAIRGKNPSDVWPIMEELMDAVAVLNPRIHAGVLRKLRG